MMYAPDARRSVVDASRRPHFDEVVVPLVGHGLQDRGLTAAIDYAERLGLPVRLVNVADAAGDPRDEAVAAAGLDAARARVAEQRSELDVTADLVVGLDVASGVVGTVHRDSLIVLATEHAGAEDGSFSVAEGIVRQWEGVVVMVGPEATVADLPGPLVVPLDGSASGEQAVTGGLALAGAWDGPVWLLHVVDPATDHKMAELRDVGYAISENALVKELADELNDGGQPAGWEIVHDADPVEAIIDFAHQRGAALIASASRGAGRTTRAFGSVSLRIVHESPVPVAIVGSSGIGT